jgi:hypothetical protein
MISSGFTWASTGKSFVRTGKIVFSLPADAAVAAELL